MDREQRAVNEAPAMLRRDDDAAVRPQLAGYAAVFGQETVIRTAFGDFREVIEPGAFTASLASDVRAVINHDPNLLLGRTTSGTLRLSEDTHGLRYEVDPPDTSYADDLLVSVQRGDITQSSFAFSIPEDGQVWDKPTRRGDLPLRRIRKVELYDVSPVTYPAYSQTSVSARASEMAHALTVTTDCEPPAASDADGAIEREHARLRVQLRAWEA